MTRQIDTTMGLVVGGIVGWFHHGFLIWALLFGTMILWGYLDYRETKLKRGKK